MKGKLQRAIFIDVVLGETPWPKNPRGQKHMSLALSVHTLALVSRVLALRVLALTTFMYKLLVVFYNCSTS